MNGSTSRRDDAPQPGRPMPSLPGLTMGLVGSLLLPGVAAATIYEITLPDSYVGVQFQPGDQVEVFQGGSILDNIFPNGTLLLVSSGGSALYTVVSSGGSATITSGGGIVHPTIANGAVFTISSGGALVVDTSDYVSSGTTARGGFTVGGNVASNVMVENGGSLTVLSGGTSINTLAGSGGTEYVLGTTSNTSVGSGGTQVVSSGGYTSATQVFSGGVQRLVGGVADQTVVSSGGTQNVSGGVASSTTVSSGGVQNIWSGGAANGTNVSGTENVFNGGVASNSVINSGTQNISSGGSAVATTIAVGVQNVFGGGVAVSTVVRSGTSENVSGGTTLSTTVLSGGMENVSSGGIARGTMVSGGATLSVLSGGSAVSTLVNSGGVENVSSGGFASGTTVSSGGVENVSSGGSTFATLVVVSGLQNVSAGGTATSTSVVGGRQNVSSGGSAVSAIVVSAGVQNVSGGGTASGTVISSGGQQTVTSATVYTAIIGLGGTQLLNNLGIAINTSAAGGALIVSSGGATSGSTVTSGGGETVSSGGTASGTTVGAGGTQTILGGGMAFATIINNGGMEYIDGVTSGVSYNAAVNSGGQQTVAFNGVASGTTVNSGGLQLVSSGGSAVSTALTGGTQNVLSGGSAVVTVVSAGGVQDIQAGGYAVGTIVSSGGAVIVDSNVTSVTLLSGATLAGSGTLGSTDINAGVVFAPGTPGVPGTSMTIAGNLALQSGAIYLVQINPSTASSANVTGSATLNGATLNAFYSSGSYVPKQYTVLSAAGGVTGSFAATVNTNLPSGFTTSLSYDANHAYLNLRLIFGLPQNLSQNQQRVGNALSNFYDTTGGIPLVYGALTPAGLSQAAGETATGAQQASFGAMSQFLGVLTDPFLAGRSDPVGDGSPTAYADESLSYAARGGAARDAYAAISTKAPQAASFAQRWNVWAAGFGGSQTTDGNVALGSNDSRSSIYGTVIGADYRISPNTLIGFGLAGGGTSFSVANGGSGRSDLFQAGAFVRHSFGAAYVTGALAYGWQDITTDRVVTIAGIDHLRAEFNANAWSGRLEGGYRFVTPLIGIAPYAAAQFTTFDLPSYAESVISGASTFALAYAGSSVTDTRSELGLRTDRSFAVQNGVLTLRGRFAWAHDFDPNRAVAATFLALPGASFVANGAGQAADSALTTASAEMKWMNGWSTTTTFEGEFSNVTQSYAGKAVLRYQW